MRSNPGEVVLTPFLGIGSEAYVPVRCGRKAIGIELKTAYYNQAVRNVDQVIMDMEKGTDQIENEQQSLFSEMG